MQKEKEFKGKNTNVLPDPSGFIDLLVERLKLKNDAQLSRLLRLAPPVISKVRHGTVALSGDTIIQIHEATGFSIREIKDMAGLPTLEYPSRIESSRTGHQRLQGVLAD